MKYVLFAIVTAASLSGCTWETYQKADGHTSLRQKYPQGTRVYYQDGTYSPNMRNNQFRPEQHAVLPQSGQQDVQGAHWKKLAAPASAAQ